MQVSLSLSCDVRMIKENNMRWHQFWVVCLIERVTLQLTGDQRQEIASRRAHARILVWPEPIHGSRVESRNSGGWNNKQVIVLCRPSTGRSSEARRISRGGAKTEKRSGRRTFISRKIRSRDLRWALAHR